MTGSTHRMTLGSLAAIFASLGMPAQAQEYYYYPPPYYAPPPPPYAYPPPYYPPPPVIIQQAPPPRPAGAPPPQFWYWCDDPQGYYPRVPTCNRTWRQVSGADVAPAGQATQKSK